MNIPTISEIKLFTLKIIPVNGGDILHGIKIADEGFNGFEEAYFSEIKYRKIKAWKRHKYMTLNLICPNGEVLFNFIDDFGGRKEVLLGRENYGRIMVPPGIWFGFKGVDQKISTIINFANISHDPNEVERCEQTAFPFFDIVRG